MLCSQAPEHGHRHDQPTHQHIPKKGMGGNNPESKIRAVLCWPMHDRIDNKDWGNGIFDGVYRAWDLHNNTIIERVLEPDSAAEKGSLTERLPIGSADKARLDDGAGSPPSSAAPSGSKSPAVKEQQPSEVRLVGESSLTAEPSVPDESDGAESDTTVAKVPSGRQEPLGSAEVPEPLEARSEGQTSAPSPPSGAGVSVASSASVPAGSTGVAQSVEHLPVKEDVAGSSPAASASYESWVKDIQSIAMVGRLWQFDLGDRALEGERLWPHESTQVLSSLGIHPGTLVNIMRVAERVPSSLRRGELRWSQHVLVAGLDRETIEGVLDRAVAEEWGVSQTRDFLRAEGHLPEPKPRVKRWTLEEIHDWLASWTGEFETVFDFLKWLEGQASLGHE